MKTRVVRRSVCRVALGTLLAASLDARAATVKLAPGVNGFAAALASAGPGGTVVVEPGLHLESGTVTIAAPVTVLGKPGAVLETPSTPAVSYPLEVVPAVHVRGTHGVVIKGLEIRPPEGTVGNTGILIENAPGTRVSANRIGAAQFGVIVQGSDDVEIADNTIAAASGWSVGDFPEGHGIVVIRGMRASIKGNNVAGATFDIWVSDFDGTLSQNMVSDGLSGVVVCRVPDGNFLISGSDAGAPAPATRWKVTGNVATGNVWGYLVIDGANGNDLVNNEAYGNQAYDIELTGETDRFGAMLPASYANRVTVGSSKHLVIKDCGVDNRVDAPTVDAWADPCF